MVGRAAQPTILREKTGVAQLVEHQPSKLRVVGRHAYFQLGTAKLECLRSIPHRFRQQLTLAVRRARFHPLGRFGRHFIAR